MLFIKIFFPYNLLLRFTTTFGHALVVNIVKLYNIYSHDQFNPLVKLIHVDEFVQSPTAQIYYF